MTQDNRIQKFIGELFDNELSQSQCAMVLGEDEKPGKKKKEKKQSKGNVNFGCVNDKQGKCETTNSRCVNYGVACGIGEVINTFACENKREKLH